MTEERRPRPIPHEMLPGHYEARLVAWTEGEEPDNAVTRYTVTSMREQVGRDPGHTLAEMREDFGGDEGSVMDATGAEHPVSLAPWRDADPETTPLMPSFRFVPDDQDAYQALMREWLAIHRPESVD